MAMSFRNVLKWTDDNLLLGFMFMFLAIGLPLIFSGVIGGSQLLVAGGAGVTTTAAIMGALFIQARKERFDVSKFYLDSATEGFETAIGLMKRDNRRSTWIAAARVLMRAEEVARSINLHEHRAVYDLVKENARYNVYALLADEEKTASYFFGQRSDMDPIEAFAKSTEGKKRGDRLLISSIQSMSEAALINIYRFSRHEAGYIDPMVREEFSNDEIDLMGHDFDGLVDYLKIVRRFYSFSGEVYECSTKKKIYPTSS